MPIPEGGVKVASYQIWLRPKEKESVTMIICIEKKLFLHCVLQLLPLRGGAIVVKFLTSFYVAQYNFCDID